MRIGLWVTGYGLQLGSIPEDARANALISGTGDKTARHKAVGQIETG